MINKDFSHLIRQHDDFLLLNFFRMLINNKIFSIIFSDDSFNFDEIYSFFDNIPILYYDNNLIEKQKVIINLNNFNPWLNNPNSIINNQKYNRSSNKNFQNLLTDLEKKKYKELIQKNKNSSYERSEEREKQVDLFRNIIRFLSNSTIVFIIISL